MGVLMVGVDKQTKGGMWTVAENYLQSHAFVEKTGLVYVSTSITGSIPKRLLFTAKALPKIAWKLASGKFPLVHVHMAERGSVYRKNMVICLAKLFRCKVLIHMHGAEFETWYRSLSPRKQKGVRKILSRADRILILGEYWREFIQSLVGEADKLRVVHNAVSVPRENPYDPEAGNLLFLGVAGQRKGVFDLLEAMAKIRDRLPADTQLLIYGPEGERSVEEAICQLGIEKRARYMGWLSRENREEVLRKTALNILPSYNEGLPMTILETMAWGIPNISTHVAAIPEAVEEANGALIVPGDVEQLANSILTLMNDPALRAEKSKQAYAKAQREFSIGMHTAKVLDIYRELMEKA